MWRLGSRSLPRGIQYDGGSDWVCLHVDFVRFVVEEEQEDPLLRGLDDIFRHTLLPAESYFHTVLRNSRFCQTYLNNNLHLTNWRRDRGCKCQHKKVVDWCGCSPNDLLPEDWKRIEATGKKDLFFGRKFEAVINQEVLDMVDAWTFPEFQGNSSTAKVAYWQNIFHILDTSPPPDPAVVELSSLLANIAVKDKLGKEAAAIADAPLVTEVTSYSVNDALKGVVISFTLGPQDYEALVTVDDHFR